MERWSGKVAVVTGASGGIGHALTRTLVAHGLLVIGFGRNFEMLEISMDRWIGKVAIVTGANGCIGVNITRAFVLQGLTVVGVDINLEQFQNLAKELQNAKGKLYPLKVDLRKEEDIVSAFHWIDQHLGAINVLINNAGVSFRTRVLDGDIEKWKQMFDVNVFALGICCREAVKSMNFHKVTDAQIININSVTGHVMSSLLSQAIYSSTKHVITVLTEALRRELVEAKSTIRISSVSPGRVFTEMIAPKGVVQASDRGPLLSPGAIADAVIYILSTPQDVQVSEMIVRPVGDLTHKTPNQII